MVDQLDRMKPGGENMFEVQYKLQNVHPVTHLYTQEYRHLGLDLGLSMHLGLGLNMVLGFSMSMNLGMNLDLGLSLNLILGLRLSMNLDLGLS